MERQNAAAIESGDVLTLASRLDSLTGSLNWNCISARRGEHLFFEKSRGPCGSGLWRQHVSVFSPNNGGLRIHFTLRLPGTLEAAAAGFLALQAALLVLLFLGVRRSERLRSEGHRRLAELAAQVAHDIRSPVAALAALEPRLGALPEEDRRLVRASLERVRAVADGLLERHRPAAQAVPEAVALAPLVSAALAEKRLQAPPSLSLEGPLPPDSPLRAMAVSKDLTRVLSNLVENSLQALGASGRVRVELEAEGADRVSLTVIDDGPGIPAEVLPRLGERGASFSKPGGTGLGLHHARASAEAWGGTLSIGPGPAGGTAVRLSLRAAPPAGAPDAVLIDDDPLVRMSWSVAARRAGKELRVYADVTAFLAEAPGLPRATTVFIDSDLGGGARGEREAGRFLSLGFRDLHLETGEDPAAFAGLAHLKSVRGKEPPWGPTEDPPRT